jgi:hypothetical protein
MPKPPTFASKRGANVKAGNPAVRAANANIEATLIDGVSNVLKIGGNTFGGSRPSRSKRMDDDNARRVRET